MTASKHSNESTYLAAQLQEVLLDGQWVAHTNYRDAIEDLSVEDALKTVNGLNSIAALTFHIKYYMAGVLQVFEGGPLNIHDRYSFDMPPLRTEADWLELKSTFLQHAQAFVKAVSETPEIQWEQTFVKPEYGTYRKNIDGFIAHSYYHLGQISLIRKLLKSEPR